MFANRHTRTILAAGVVLALGTAATARAQGGPDVRVNQDPPGRTQNESSLALNPLAPVNFVAAFNDQPWAGGGGLGVAASWDGGVTWMHQLLPIPPGFGFVDAFDPITSFDTAGFAYAGFITTDGVYGGNCGVAVCASPDGGLTWPFQTYAALATTGPFYDKPHMAADTFMASPYAGNVYVTFIQENIVGPGPWSDICFVYATPPTLPPAGIFQFSNLQVISDLPPGIGMGNGPNIAVGSDGRIYVAWTDCDVTQQGQLPGTIYIDSSLDGGVTWGPDATVRNIITLPDRLTGDNLQPLTGPTARSFCCIETDPNNPLTVYMVYPADPDGPWVGDEADVFFTRSTDGGQTWSAPVTLNLGFGNHDFEPWIAAKPDGTIDVAWYQGHHTGVRYEWEVMLTRSVDRGMTWSPPVAINDLPFPTPVNPWGQQWMGEYLSLTGDLSSAHLTFVASQSNTAADALGDVYFDTVLNASMPVPCDGDLNGDGAVDLADLALMLANYGNAGGMSYRQGDLDGDQDVDLADLALMLANYGRVCSWADSFDTYAAGSDVDGQGGWAGWDNLPGLGATVTAGPAQTPPNSLDVQLATDIVQTFNFATAGTWEFDAWMYIPSGFTSGGTGQFDGTYIVMMSTYTPGGTHNPQDWAVQIQFDSNDGMLKAFYGNGTNTVAVPYVTDQWVPVRILIDLNADRVDIYYNGAFVVGYQWSIGVTGAGGGALNIAAVDLFANGSSSVYYDDLSLRAK